ncbi:hypothetical protein GCM10008106_29080 [Mongoliitalea lutea]|uniref:DUF4890 domain-containing protein n=2 Tax=Mongoliitalea lutea TaxID=849756 RepID=A0A8J3D1P0_9BACT|nr:hypothetical protein GCM10008106_29080 [Mongoliitalea lutea]
MFHKYQTIEAMNKLLLIATMLLISFAGFAQRGPGPNQNPEERAKRMTERMSEQLALTAEQQEAVYAINLENATKRQAEFEARREEREQMRSKMMQQQRAQRDAIQEVLTPEQKEKWEEMRAQNQQRRGQVPQMQNRERQGEGPRMQNRRGWSEEGARPQGKRSQERKRKGPPTSKLNPIMN